MVCFERTSISMCTNGVDISGLHVLTFSMQIIALDDYSHKDIQTTLYWYNLGKISMPRIPRELLGCWKQELQRKRCLCKFDRLCRQLEVWDGVLCRPEAQKIFHVAVDHVWPRRRKTAIFWTNICETTTAAASVTPGAHNPRISAQTVRNCLNGCIFLFKLP